MYKGKGTRRMARGLNYSNLPLNRIANISGVTWVTADNSTYDENNQYFFFQGNANRTPP
jgi:hypothetical protein